MSSWINAINPLNTARTEADARRAARASALAIFLGVLWGVWGVYYMMTDGREIMDAAMAQSTAATPEMAGMAGAMTSIAMGMGIAMVVIQAIFGLVQWFKPNIVIPIIFTILVAYGLANMGLSQFIGEEMRAQMNVPEVPQWQTILSWVVLIFQLIMHIAGIRGAAALGKLRQS